MNKKVIFLLSDIEAPVKSVKRIPSDNFLLVKKNLDFLENEIVFDEPPFCIAVYLSQNSRTDFKSIKISLFSLIECPIINLNSLSKFDEFFLSIGREKMLNALKISALNAKRTNSILKNKEMAEYYYRVKRACDTDGIILLTGESGTGKNYTASLIHKNSARRKHNFINLNLTEITPTLIESKLFGTTKSSYTGAADKKGIFEEVQKGTLCLDEIHEMEFELQTKIYDLMDSKKFCRLGSNTKNQFLGRLIFTTNGDLKKLVDEGKFKEALYYRIKIFVIQVPPLRLHMQDIDFLAAKFADEYGKTLSSQALKKLHQYDWPGNVRELKNTVQSACVYEIGNTVSEDSIFFE